MKTFKLLLTFALIGIFQLANAQSIDTVLISGQISNTNGAPINVFVSINDSGNWMYATATADASGNYSTGFIVNSSQGTVDLYFHDCLGDTVYGVQQSFTVATGTTNIVFPTLNYCTPAPTGCNAYFDIDQAYFQNGSPVAGTLVVTDSSVGSSAVANLTYTWTFGDGNSGTGSQLAHTYSGNGPYVLCLTIDDGLGCTDTYCDTISVDSLGMIIEQEGFTLVIGDYDAPLSIQENDFSSTVKLYPNPASNFVNIEFDAKDKALNRITIFDLSGKIVFEENTNTSNNLTTINTENIEKGTYIVQMLFDNELHNQKVILK